MGTSTHNGGQKGGTPLVPSWLEQPNENTPSEITPDSDNNEVCRQYCGACRPV